MAKANTRYVRDLQLNMPDDVITYVITDWLKRNGYRRITTTNPMFSLPETDLSQPRIMSRFSIRTVHSTLNHGSRQAKGKSVRISPVHTAGALNQPLKAK